MQKLPSTDLRQNNYQQMSCSTYQQKAERVQIPRAFGIYSLGYIELILARVCVTMDDSLEQPTAIASAELFNATENDERESSEDEDEADDGALDWTKLFNKPAIPKRGEKQFEPSLGLGNESGLQQTVLQRAREAMFTTLQATRAKESKSLSYAIWIPELRRVHVTVAKGVLLASMGHSARRPTVINDQVKYHKRLELLPEEAIYLIERGSMFCWKEGQSSIDGVPGTPMSVQHAYTEMIGKEDLTLERFQVRQSLIIVFQLIRVRFTRTSNV